MKTVSKVFIIIAISIGSLILAACIALAIMDKDGNFRTSMKEAFEENIGVRYTADKTSLFDVIPSTFDFTKSPVFFLNRYKMSFKEKERSIECLKPIVYNIIERKI